MTDAQAALKAAREALIKRLRAPSNWLQQPRGEDWKSVVSEYDRAPFEAADALEAALAENERLARQLAEVTKGVEAVRTRMIEWRSQQRNQMFYDIMTEFLAILAQHVPAQEVGDERQD